jgi:hypothetical protein
LCHKIIYYLAFSIWKTIIQSDFSYLI